MALEAKMAENGQSRDMVAKGMEAIWKGGQICSPCWEEGGHSTAHKPQAQRSLPVNPGFCLLKHCLPASAPGSEQRQDIQGESQMWSSIYGASEARNLEPDQLLIAMSMSSCLSDTLPYAL